MKLQRHHLFLLLPPTLIFATWVWTTSSTSLPQVAPSVPHFAFTTTPSIDEFDADIARLYRQLRLPKPIRAYPPDLSDKQKRRFAALRAPRTQSQGEQPRKGDRPHVDDNDPPDHLNSSKERTEQVYYLTSNLLNAAAVLPDIITSLIVLATFLGPKHIFISIVEGPSTDGTGDILTHILRPRLLALGVPSSQIQIKSMREGNLDWDRGGGSGRDRIEVLAELRNVALEPLVSQAETHAWGPIVFVNDVLFSAAHVLELLHRHRTNEASMTCAWDVLYNPPTLFTWHPTTQFYDSWVGRTLNGATFFPVGASKKDWKPDQLFNEASSPEGIERDAFASSTPFAVFSCFNGISVFDPTPFLPILPPSDPTIATPPSRPPLRFRVASVSSGELAHSEALLIGRDLWRLALANHQGAARIQVVPGVKVGYEVRMARLLLSQAEAEGHEIGIGDGEEKINWSGVTGPDRIMGYGWPEDGVRAKGNPWLHGKWVDALYG